MEIKTYNRNIFKNKEKNAYTKEMIESADKIAYNKNNIHFFGSNIMKSMYLSSGDIDIVESISKDTSAKHLSKKISNIVNQIVKEDNVFLGDFKSGVDDVYNINIGYVDKLNVKDYDAKRIYTDMKSLKFETEDRKAIKHILKTYPSKITIPQWLELKELFRKYYILRWDRNELEKGYKIIRGKKFYLKDTLKMDSLNKIDTIQLINGRYIEITNVYDLINKFDKNEFREALKENLIKYFLNHKYYKSIKRMYAIAKLENDTKTGKLLFPMLHSGFGVLYQIISDMSAILFILENHSKKVPWEKIQYEIDNFRWRLSYIYELKIPELLIYSDLEEMASMKPNKGNVKKLISILDKDITLLSDLLNEKARLFLKDVGLYPLPLKYYPTKLEPSNEEKEKADID